MPRPIDIKTNNTLTLIGIYSDIAEQLGVKSATVCGATLSIYIEGMLTIASNEGIDMARRNLDKAIELLTALRNTPHAEAMRETAEAIAARHNAEVLNRER